ncbi:MAG TPA: ABC transporter permease [Acidimicrobiales bacterium]|nr:ABC transporter permease [Acidimicrobiales bacterium]
MNRRAALWGSGAVAAIAASAWVVARIAALDTETQARNPIVRWEWLFVREETRGELWDATFQHLTLTLMAVAIGLVVASALAAIALRLRWTFAPITAFTGFLYTIPSVALFGLLVTRFGNTVSAEIALVSYTLLVLVRNIVAGIDGVPESVTDAADGLGLSRTRRLLTIELPLALPVIVAGIRVATVTTVGLVGVTAIIQLGGLGRLIFDGYASQYYTKMVVGSALSVLLALVLDVVFHRVEVVLTPWARRRGAR